MFQGLWSGIASGIGSFSQLGAMHYANASGLTDKEMTERREADIRKKAFQQKAIYYALIGVVVIVLLILILRRK